MYVERAGEHGPMVVLVHGSVLPGWGTWSEQRPLADRYRLVLPHRTGYPPNPPLELIDFAVQAHEIAELIEPGTHLVGHSYGGVVSMLTSALVPGGLRSLTVIEPPAFGVAWENPAVRELVERLKPVYEDRSISTHEFLRRFVEASGSSAKVPDPLPPAVEASGAASRVERYPWEAEIPFEAIRAGGFPALVFSGGHSAAFDAVCDVICERLGAEREVITGSRHSVQRTGAPFNDRLERFIQAAEAAGG
jgi:pimeloyl-ACP methyl ester carboxylesterase